MAHIFTLPSGQTMLLPDDTLPEPEMEWGQALQHSAGNLFEKGSPPFIGRIQGELSQKKQDIQALIDQGQISEHQGWTDLAVELFKAHAQIIEEEAQILYLDIYEDELKAIKNRFLRKRREQELRAEARSKIDALRQKNNL